MPRVPKETSTYKQEPKLDKYTVGFAPELVPFIESGEKVKTYRFGDKYDYLNGGDIVKLQNTKTNEILGSAKITGKTHTIFADLPLKIPGHETYENKEHQRRIFSGYYAYLGRPIQDTDPFLVLEFQLVERIS